MLRSAVIVGRALAGTVVACDLAAQSWRTRQIEPQEIVASGLRMRAAVKGVRQNGRPGGSSGERRFRNVRGRADVDYSRSTALRLQIQVDGLSANRRVKTTERECGRVVALLGIRTNESFGSA